LKQKVHFIVKRFIVMVKTLHLLKRQFNQWAPGNPEVREEQETKEGKQRKINRITERETCRAGPTHGPRAMPELNQVDSKRGRTCPAMGA
jgi:hypothetical protein